MFPCPPNKNLMLRLLTAIIAGIFYMQSSLASASLTNHSNNSSFGELCATQKLSSDDVGNPTSPRLPASHHSFCCIFHTEVAYFPPKISFAYLIRLQFPEDIFELSATETVPPHRLEPSRAPQSPRAPPHQG